MNQLSSAALIELSIALAKGLAGNERFDNLITTIRTAITCEAVAILAFKGDHLIPLAQQGLSSDTLGRRFTVSEHPRFDIICSSKKAVRFPSHSALPDPYDGLLIDTQDDLPVHACLGIPLYFEDALLGVLTLDSLVPGIFDNIPERTLEVIAAMASVSLNTALTLDLLESHIQRSQQVVEALSQSNTFSEAYELIGQSGLIQKLKQEITLVASSQFNVLIEGESGSGKELVAHNVHQQSERRSSPIIYVNCAALPENLVESELFGHVKGAFTGADKARAGKFVIADGGTLFLDEIGELPLSVQSKLLRVLQSNEVQPIGQDEVVRVDVRVIAATNRDLQKEVEEGRFRADLFHRLNVFPIHVPSLRDRPTDIALLSGYFVEKTKRRIGVPQLKLASDTLNYFEQYHWPGNVRELEHCISRAALKAAARYRGNAHSGQGHHPDVVSIGVQDCDLLILESQTTPDHVLHTGVVGANTVNENLFNEGVSNQRINHEPDSLVLRDEVDRFQRDLVLRFLQQEKGNVSACARRLGTDRANLNRLIKRLGIRIHKVVG